MASSPSAAAAIPSSGAQQTVVAKGRRYRQRPLGPAPCASFEDLSDELDSPPETARVPLPGIKEDPASQIQTPSTPHNLVLGISLTEKEDQGLKEALSGSLETPAPPRIDISRASSSSQHEDSITSSPDREGGNQNLGYKEDGTIDLRSSTEELDYIQEPGTVEESEAKRKREKMMKKQQQLKQDFCDTQSEIDFKERKNSNCSIMSEGGLLCISGRTSRLSSIGSAASGGSVASGASHLTAGSHMSGRSTRSPSPHKMLLETSFCGSKPMHTQSIEAEAAPTLVSLMEKQSSRPPSRLCSRSPSPHKMFLETSFCGAKQILPPAEPQVSHDMNLDIVRKKKSNINTKSNAEELSQTVQKTDSKLTSETLIKNEAKVQEIKKTEVKEVLKPKKAKPVSLPKLPDKRLTSSKPKKIISIRDIPADEIYIPLKGPEVDLEEIIRKASPNLKRKVEKSSEDIIFIPLHSPTEGEMKKKPETSTFKQNFDDGIYIPLHSPPKSPTPVVSKTKIYSSSKEKALGTTANKITLDLKSTPKIKPDEPRKTKYEVCEDGSIFIPLHSPDEESRPIRNFEEEIRRVDKELQKARELAEKRLQEEEERQNKPSTLDLSEFSGNRQSLTSGRPETALGGSRTPSPGSTLSRKSSFASLFRRNDVTGSPDSSGGSLVRKKSGTFTNLIKDAGDGLRDRSRSRSKNRERLSQSAVVRSPSNKKNVFTNLFGKKKGDEKANYGKTDKTDDKTSTSLDHQYSYTTETEKRKCFAEEGDYIIIPLRDPSDPSPGLEDEIPDEDVEIHEENPSSPVVVLERLESPSSCQATKEKRQCEDELRRVPSNLSTTGISDIGKDKLAQEGDERSIEDARNKVAVIENIEHQSDPTNLSEEKIIQPTPPRKGSAQSTWTKPENTKGSDLENKESKKKEIENGVIKDDERGIDLQYESSLDMDECPVKEEMMAVSSGGVRTLKLPPEPGDLGDDHERKGLVLQESFEDELPYIPTTLPLERSVGVPIVPVRHRVAEIKTCPIDRPRSTTPINPSTLEDYVNVKEPPRVSAEEKMKISLPREDSVSGKSKSPRRFSAKGKSWFEFAEAVSHSPKETRKSSLSTTSSSSPPPLPPRSSPPVGLSTSAPQATSSWINFEELPEKRKQPKRITTVPPLRSSADGGIIPEKPNASHSGNIVYSYVSPEDCQCECHDHNAHTTESHSKESKSNRGMKQHINPRLDLISEIKNKPHSANELIKTQGDIEISVKNECEDCENGRHMDNEEDIEKKPLLECNSEGENGDSTSRRETEWELAVPGRKNDVDRQSLLSDSSNECHEAGSFEIGGDREVCVGMKPFEMDFDVKSNRSSLVSQDEASPEEVSSSNPL